MNNLHDIKLNDRQLQAQVFSALRPNSEVQIEYLMQLIGLKKGQVTRGLSLLCKAGLVDSKDISKQTRRKLYWRVNK